MIHPTAIIGPKVKVQSGAKIGQYCVIQGDTWIGENVQISPHVVIGTSAEHKEFKDHKGVVIIGQNTIIREFVTINAGTTQPTIVGKDCWLLRGSHIGHDVTIEGSVTLSCNALIGGHARVFRGSNLGLGAVVHQWCHVAHYSMIGMNSTVTKKTDTRPCRTYVGSPARLLGVNPKQKSKLEFEKTYQQEIENFKEAQK